MGDIIELQFINIAKGMDDPFIYVMTLLTLGFKPHIYRKLANKCWNKAHPDKKLPEGRNRELFGYPKQKR